MSYQYDFAGHLVSETYPSNRVVTSSYDAAGRINDLSSGTTHYASQFSYAAHGGVTDLKLGNNLWEHTTFEPNRLQPTEIDLGTSQGASDKLKLNYDYGPLTLNNGDVIGQTITIPSGPALTQSFTYDALNRLKSAQESNGSSWKQTFLYDQFGNRTIDGANTMPSGLVGPNPQVSSSTNRITSAGYSYDHAGNLIADGIGHTYSYDAENMQVTYDTSVAKYAYDGEGRRVRSIINNGALTTVFVYDAMGKLLAEYTNTNPTGGGTSYLTTDALGSTRIVSGTDPANPVKARHDYLPFGEEITVSLGGRTAAQGYIADSVRQKFTGKQRDVETGLDYFGARYYSSATGRFTSPDSLGGDSINPQTLNLYIYVSNNPLAFVDPTGHFANPDGALDKLNGWADNKEDEFNRWIEEVDARQEGKNAAEQNEANIRNARADGGDLVLYEAGINNPTYMHTLEARNALIDWLNVPINQIGAVPNGSGYWGGFWAKPDKSAAKAMADLLSYAINNVNIDPSNIIIVAHSNGVPTLSLALSMSKAASVAKFKEIVLVAPATKNVATVTNIANHSKAVAIVTSSRDSSLAWTWNKRSASSWQKQLKDVHNVSFFETYNKGHAMISYFEALLNGRYRRLQ
jgi:RHS repeat-associated protein